MALEHDEANSKLGLASRELAFVLVEQIAGKDWRDRDINKIQEVLFRYGDTISLFTYNRVASNGIAT